VIESTEGVGAGRFGEQPERTSLVLKKSTRTDAIRIPAKKTRSKQESEEGRAGELQTPLRTEGSFRRHSDARRTTNAMRLVEDSCDCVNLVDYRAVMICSTSASCSFVLTPMASAMLSFAAASTVLPWLCRIFGQSVR
jgi:hypothetical protein